MTRAYVGLGANLGDPAAQLRAACHALRNLPGTRLLRCSPIYRSAPIGVSGHPDYLNAVAELDTELTARALLDALLDLETEFGRCRDGSVAPRTLDLDLLLHGQAQLPSPQLTLPHPRMHLRAFVLKPLLDLAPDITLPGLGPASGWLPACADQACEPLA